MKGTKQATRRPRLSHLRDTKTKIVSRQLRLPRDLDAWLVDFAIRRGFPSEVEAVRQMVRETRERDQAAAA